uniref:Uncharacterized protein n=1 Tax=Arundo donax TaxID=35708 RepID=A0A0A9CLA7_ARUDO
MSCSLVQQSEAQNCSFPSLSIPHGSSLFSSAFINLLSPILGCATKEESFSLFLLISFLVSMLGAISWQSGGNDWDSR